MRRVLLVALVILACAAATTFGGGLTLSPTTGTFTLANGKTLTVNLTVTFAGADGHTFTLPAASDTLAGLATAQTFTAAQTFSNSGNSTSCTMVLGRCTAVVKTGCQPQCTKRTANALGPVVCSVAGTTLTAVSNGTDVAVVNIWCP